ncbi:hypothetical protein BGZ54_003504, partial [Gamsiella multidivaricata]
VILIETELSEDFEFYEEFEEVVLRSSSVANEIIEYAKTEQYVVAPKETWFYLVAGNKVASICPTILLEREADGAAIELFVQKKFSSAERHALVDLQLWKLEGSYIINRFTGLYLTVDSNGALILFGKQADASRQQWKFSEDGSLSLISNTSQIVDFVNNKAILVERSASKTVWVYDAVKFTWLTSLETATSYDVSLINREITEYRTVYTRYIQYLTKYTVITTTTTITRTRRIVRVHSQLPIENATVLEKNGTVWACHLVEAGTSVDYVMQLVHDNTKNVYYIYIQWGSTQGQLEGPYESDEEAIREFQEIFVSKVGIEWTERETAVSGEAWTSVDFEYDTVVIEDERSVPKSGTTTTTKQTITTSTSSQPLVDQICPIASEVTIYKDSEIYHTVLTQRETGIIYITQLLYNTVTKTYYVYLRWGDSDYTLDGPYDTVEIAKSHFKTKYSETFGITWEQRNITTNVQWQSVYQTFDTEDIYQDILSDEGEEDDFAETISTVVTTDTKNVVSGDKVTVIKTTDTVVDDKATKETAVVTKTTTKTLTLTEPIIDKKTSWFRRLAAGAGAAATVALIQADGVWKRTAKVVNTRKAKVDEHCPMSKISFVYYDEDVYDAELVEKSTGVKYVTQLIYNTETKAYYVYYRWSETEYQLDGPHETVEEAKSAYLITYKEKFDVEWKERETTVSEKWSYEFKTYETYEEIEDIVEEVDEAEVATIIARQTTATLDDKATKTEVSTTTTKDEEVIETVQDVSVLVEDKVQLHETVITKTEEDTHIVNVETNVEEVVKHVAVTENTEEDIEVIVKKNTGVITKPAVTKETYWFRRLATGASVAAVGALAQIDGVWKRTVQVITAHKGHVDERCPMARTSIVYYDEDVYDAELVEKSTGVKYVTQLIYNTETKAYYVYYRWSETEYQLDGPHETVEEAKSAYLITYKEKFGVEWKERETTVSEKWTYETKTYETIEEVEEVEEIIDATEAETIIARGGYVTVNNTNTQTEVIIKTAVDEKTIAYEHTTTETTESTENVSDNKEKIIILEDDRKSTVSREDKDIKVTTVAVVEQTRKVDQPAVTKSNSWFRRLASGAGEVAAGALTRVDGVWKRTVQVITAHKGHVDERCPMARTSIVYYDEDVYDAELVEKSTGVKYVTQLIYNTETKAYYVYYRWSETEYQLDGPHETVEEAKSAYLIT